MSHRTFRLPTRWNGRSRCDEQPPATGDRIVAEPMLDASTLQNMLRSFMGQTQLGLHSQVQIGIESQIAFLQDQMSREMSAQAELSRQAQEAADRLAAEARGPGAPGCGCVQNGDRSKARRLKARRESGPLPECRFVGMSSACREIRGPSPP